MLTSLLLPYQAACEAHFARLLSSRPLPSDGRITLTPSILAEFPDVPVEVVRQFIASKGLLGELAQLSVLLPRYLAENADALDRVNAINDLRAWLRTQGCRPQTIQILRQIRHLGRRFSLNALPPEAVHSVKQMFADSPHLLEQPVCYNGAGGLIAFARERGIKADKNTLVAIFETFPLTIARGQAVSHNRLDQPMKSGADLTAKFCQQCPDGLVPASGREGLIAYLATRGVLVYGHQAVDLIEGAGRQALAVKRPGREEIVAALNEVIGDTVWGKRPRQITGCTGLFAQVLKIGVDCSADSVKRAYVNGGGHTKSSVVRRARDYSRKLPALLLRLRETESDYFSQPVAVRGPGGLKGKVWKEGIRANHEIIRRYAEAVGIELRKGGRSARAA